MQPRPLAAPAQAGAATSVARHAMETAFGFVCTLNGGAAGEGRQLETVGIERRSALRRHADCRLERAGTWRGPLRARLPDRLRNEGGEGMDDRTAGRCGRRGRVIVASQQVDDDARRRGGENDEKERQEQLLRGGQPRLASRRRLVGRRARGRGRGLRRGGGLGRRRRSRRRGDRVGAPLRNGFDPARSSACRVSSGMR